MPLDLFTKKRLGVWAIVLLVALNLTVISTFWWTQLRKHPLPDSDSIVLPPNGREEMPDILPFLARDLRLTRTQMQELRQIRDETLPAIREKWLEMHQLRKSLNEAMFKDETDPNQVQTWSRRIGEIQAELEWTKYEHLLAIKSICTPQQRKRLRFLLNEVMHRVRPPGRPGRGGPGRGGPGRGMPSRRGPSPGRRGPGGRGPGPRGPLHSPPGGQEGPPGFQPEP